jgi:anti-anti-sigma factor
MKTKRNLCLFLALAAPMLLAASGPKSREVQGVTVIDLAGAVNGQEAALLRVLLLSHIDHGKTSLIANCVQMTAIGQDGVDELVQAAKLARQRGGVLVLGEVSSRVAPVVRKHDPNAMLRIFNTEQEGVDYIKQYASGKEKRR